MIKQNVAVIDYNAGNVQSVLFALKRYNVEAVLTRDATVIRSADKVLFPGVGEASSTMQFLKKYELEKLIPQLKQPVLGICLGLQLLCAHSEENDTTCLGLLPIQVKRFVAHDPSMKIPHMGWNTIQIKESDWLPKEVHNKHVYFVHSYYAEINDFTIGTCDYAQTFSAIIQKDNFYATQFHVEKSGPVGLKILESFLQIKS